MNADIRTLDALELWNRPSPGHVAGWVRVVIVAACAATITVAALGGHVMWFLMTRAESNHHDKFWFCNALALALAVSLIWAFVPPARTSRFVRLAVILPIAQAIAMLWAWVAFGGVVPKQTTPVLEHYPIAIALGVAAAGSCGVAWLVARKRRGERLHALVTMALVHLLVLGLWLPIASWLATGKKGETPWVRDATVWTDTGLAFSPALVAFVLVPAFVVAAGITALIMRFPDGARRRRIDMIVAVCVLVLVGVMLRLDARNNTIVVYDNFTHVLFALAFVAIGALAALGAATWLHRRAPAPDPADRTWCTGTITTDDAATDVVGCIEIASWLRGPRALVRPFVVTTTVGDVPIEQGAQLVTRLPLVSTSLRTGESAVVLRTGDRVHVGGFVEGGGDHPFRASTIVPGTSGLVVLPATDRPGGFANATLALWRPCLAYLAIATAIALPALVAAFTPPSL